MIGKVLSLASALAVANSSPVLLSHQIHPLAYNALHPYSYLHHPYAVAPQQAAFPVPFTTASQYHAQDELGQTSYGYAHPGSSKAEYRDAFGNVVGGYSYIDANNKEVRVSYVSDANGFRVTSNNLPVAPVADPSQAPAQVQETPEVIEAKRQHFEAIDAAKAAVAAANSRSKRSVSSAILPHQPLAYNALPYAYNTLPYAYNAHPYAYNALPYSYGYAHPYSYANAHPYATVAQPLVVPSVHPLPIPSVTSTRYHAQDELGQASYGHAHEGQSHAAVRDINGDVVGSYAYINPDGKEIRVSYTAGHGGFRVISNALPEGSTFADLPAVVQDTEEVVAAREAHLKAFKEAKERIRESS